MYKLTVDKKNKYNLEDTQFSLNFHKHFYPVFFVILVKLVIKNKIK